MKTIDNEDIVRKQSYSYVMADNKRQEREYKKLYSNAQIAKADIFFAIVNSAYTHSRVYLNYRAAHIGIKVERPVTADRISKQVSDLETYCDKNNIEIVKTATGLIYRIPRK